MTEKEYKTFNRLIMYDTIHRLHHEEHQSIRWIADYLGVNFRTVKKYLRMDPNEFQQYSESLNCRGYLLEPYKGFIVERLKLFQDTPAAQMHDWLKEHYPFFPIVAPKTVYNYVIKLRQEHNLPKTRVNERQYECLPETPPGKYAQVDFGTYKMRQSDGKRKRVYFMGMLLCHSRYKFIWFQEKPFTSEDAVYAHELAFRYFHGIPGFIIYDQDAVFLYDENLGDYHMTDVFGSYIKSRPFKPIFCRPADPESKGKIENVVKYVKQNFLLNRSYSNPENLNIEAEAWLKRTGNAMVHNTTCRIPYEVWCSECSDLQPYIPVTSSAPEKGHKVQKTNSHRYKGNTYSLPFGTYRGEETRVLVDEEQGVLVVKTMDGQALTKHLIPAGRGEKVINKNHQRDKSSSIEKISQQVRSLFTDTSAIDIFLSRLRERYPRYMRDQLTTLLNCLAKYEQKDSDKALKTCLTKGLYSANDFKSVLSSSAFVTGNDPEVIIKPLGNPDTRLMINIRPKKSTINAYEDLFKSN